MATIAFHDPRLAHVAGGGEQTTLLLAQSLAEAGHDVTIVTRAGPSSPLLRDTLASCPALRLEALAAPNAVAEFLPDPFVTREEQFALAQSDRLSMDSLAFNTVASRLYEPGRFDLVVVSFLPDLCGLPDRRNYVVHLFGLPPSTVVADLESSLLRRTRHVVSVSAYVTSEFRRLFPDVLRDRNVHLLHPGIAEEFYEIRTPTGKKFDVCYVGRLTRRKGVADLLAAIGGAARRLTCVVVGDGSELHSLRETVIKLGLEDRVAMPGIQSRREVAASIDASRVFVYPPVLPEAFGCAPLEAMARGTPVVTTNLGGMTEYIRPDHNALVCEPANAKSLADCVTRLLLDRDLYRSVADEGKATASEFGPHTAAAQAVRLYGDFIETRLS